MIEAWLTPLIEWLGVGSLATLLLLIIAVCVIIRTIKGD